VNKVLIGVGIFAAVVFIAAIGLVAGGVWFKGKSQDGTHGTEKVQSLEQRAADLNLRYPFTEPIKGQPLQLAESRLQDYLKIRLALKPVLDDFQVKARQFEPPKGEQPNLGKSFQALGMMTELRGELSAQWLDELERRKMSPHEFQVITFAIYTPQGSKVNATLVEKYKKRIDEASSTGLDALLVGNGNELGAALQDTLGGDGSEPDPKPSK
jgi:hypothetical protein